MSLQERIEKEYIEAYKARNADRVGVLRLLKTAVKNRLVELKRPQASLEDSEMLDVIIRQAKQRQDSVEQYTMAGRKDLADKEAAELEILREYLPKTLDAEELAAAIEAAIIKSGASGPGDMGKVIGLVMGENRGRVDGKAVSEAVRKRLSSQK